MRSDVPAQSTTRSAGRGSKHSIPATSRVQTSRFERAQGFARLAMSAGAGDDVGALTASARRTRLRLDGDALRVVAIALVVVALIATVSAFLQRSTHANAYVEPDVESGVIEEEPSTASSEPSHAGATSGGAHEQAEEPEMVTSIVVHVSGAVMAPGLVEIESGGRVNDAVNAAGGLSAEADPSAINLAALVTDGTHVHIPAAGELGRVESSGGESGEAPGEGSATVNINIASQSELETIPGVGPVTAQAIIEWREAHGPFTSVDQLIEISGIGERTLERIRPHVSI